MSTVQKPYPAPVISVSLFVILLLGMIAAILVLLSVDDRVYLKVLIEDSGPVQMVGQTAIFIAFGLACMHC